MHGTEVQDTSGRDVKTGADISAAPIDLSGGSSETGAEAAALAPEFADLTTDILAPTSPETGRTAETAGPGPEIEDDSRPVDDQVGGGALATEEAKSTKGDDGESDTGKHRRDRTTSRKELPSKFDGKERLDQVKEIPEKTSEPVETVPERVPDKAPGLGWDDIE